MKPLCTQKALKYQRGYIMCTFNTFKNTLLYCIYYCIYFVFINCINAASICKSSKLHFSYCHIHSFIYIFRLISLYVCFAKGITGSGQQVAMLLLFASTCLIVKVFLKKV